jgi:hypothetical protein
MTYDANKHLVSFHDDRVFVTESELTTYRNRREANRARLKTGLDKDNDPQPSEHVQQGSYAMDTMVNSDTETSDIDDGAVFTRNSLKGERGGDKSPADAKEMVRKALASGNSFKAPPEVRNNCVRVHYNDGFHVDVPVYRSYEENGNQIKELASSSWVASKPEDITNWFKGQVSAKSPDTVKGRQMRRVVRLLKYWTKSRSSWKMPSGFVLSVLTDEAYQSGGWNERDDQALLAVMRGIKNRITWDEKVYRPVTPRDEITSGRTYSRIQKLRDELTNAISELSKIERADCDELMALKDLKSVFCTDFFDTRIKELEDGGGSAKAAAVPRQPIDKRGGSGQYAA